MCLAKRPLFIFFEANARFECWVDAGTDVDRFPCPRIAAGAWFAAAHLESSEASDGHFLLRIEFGRD